MAFDVSTLTAYTEQNKQELITSSVFGAKTIGMITPMLGVKSSETINIIETNARFQADDCSWNASGDTTFSQRTLTVGKIKVQEELCVKDLEAYYLQTMLPRGSMYENLPFEQIYTQKKAEYIAAQLETGVWQGSTTSGDPNLKRFDGFNKIIDNASGVVTATAQASISASTVRGIFQDIYEKIPVAILDKDDLRCFCGWDTFRTLIDKLTTDNLYHYTADDAAKSGEMYYPGTTLKIVAVNGLNASNYIVAARLSNLYFGTDLLNEEESFKIFLFEDGGDNIRFSARFKAGVQIAFPGEIVRYKNS